MTLILRRSETSWLVCKARFLGQPGFRGPATGATKYSHEFSLLHVKAGASVGLPLVKAASAERFSLMLF